LPSTSLDVSMRPLPLRSTQPDTAPAILVTVGVPPKARLAIHRSLFRSMVVREGQLPVEPQLQVSNSGRPPVATPFCVTSAES
jgi:hypothetical protein